MKTATGRMWGQPPSAVRRAQRGLSRPLEILHSALVLLRGCPR